MEDRTFLIAIFGLFASASFIVWVVARTVTRLRQPQVPSLSAGIDARLERIEAAVEAIAIEVERNGELQRFNSRLVRTEPAPEPLRIERHITPH